MASTAIVLVAASTVGAGAAILGQNTDGDVYSIDTTTGAITQVFDGTDRGPNGDSAPNGLGFNGDFYNAEFSDTPPSVFKNDAFFANAAGTGISGAFATSDTYYYVDNATGDFYSMDLGTGVSTNEGNVLDPQAAFGDLVLAPDGDTVYLSGTENSGGTNQFSSFSLSAVGPATVIAQPSTNYAGLAYDGDTLFGLTFAGVLDQIDPTNGTSSNITTLAFGGWTDAATIPLPASILMLLGAFGSLGLFARGRRKVA